MRIVNVGDPSSGKTPAEGTIIELVRAIEMEMAKDHPDLLRRHEAKKLEAKLERERWEDQVKSTVNKGVEPPDQPEKAVEPDNDPQGDCHAQYSVGMGDGQRLREGPASQKRPSLPQDVGKTAISDLVRN